MSPGKPKRQNKNYSDNWGGPRRPGPGKQLGRIPKPKPERREPVYSRFNQKELAMLAALVSAGYGDNPADVIRRAVVEAYEQREKE